MTDEQCKQCTPSFSLGPGILTAPWLAPRSARVRGWALAWPFQREAAALLSTRQRAGLWCSTGIGKTFMLLLAWALRGYPSPILFITKALGRHVFTRDAAWGLGEDYAPGILWSGASRPPGVHNTFGRRTYTSLEMALSEHIGVSTNYDILDARFQELVKIPWKAIVFDEVHEIKGGHKPPKMRNGKLHYLRYHFCRALADSTRARGGIVVSGTATPIINRRRDLFAQVDVVLPKLLGNAWHFMTTYCDGTTNQWGGLVADGESNTEELDALLRDRFVVIKRSDVADQMPPISRDVSLVPFDGELVKYQGGSIETALDRAAEMKIPAVLDATIDALSSGLKVLLVVTRRRIAQRISVTVSGDKFAEKLPRAMRDVLWVKCVTGEMAAAQRVTLIEEFNAKKEGPAIIVATLDSLRDSVDLQQTDLVLVGAFPHTPGALIQLDGRFSRLNGRPVSMRYFVAERTIDEFYKMRIIDKMDDLVSLGAETQGTNGAYSALRGEGGEKELLASLLADLDQFG